MWICHIQYCSIWYHKASILTVAMDTDHLSYINCSTNTPLDNILGHLETVSRATDTRLDLYASRPRWPFLSLYVCWDRVLKLKIRLWTVGARRLPLQGPHHAHLKTHKKGCFSQMGDVWVYTVKCVKIAINRGEKEGKKKLFQQLR